MELKPISIAEAARYMGVEGEPQGSTAELLRRCEELVRRSVRPVYVYRECGIVRTESGELHLEGTEIQLTGNDIRRHLQHCSRAAVLAATLSVEADKLIRQAQVRDMAEALAVDSLCSAAVEQVCDEAEREIFSGRENEYRTWRFSPGYGDFPIESQKSILNALNAQRRAGLTVTDSYLMLPTKSVTAIIGISDEPFSREPNGCDACRLKGRCAYAVNGGCGKT